MNDPKDMAERFQQWLDVALTSLTPFSSIDVHIDEICQERPLLPRVQVGASTSLFSWVLANMGARLAGKVVMLMIPLKNAETLDTTSPLWTALEMQLSATPASIYVMEVSAFLQADPASRYIAPIDVPNFRGESIAAYYQCWRNPDDSEDEGWSRDVRIIATGFLAP